MKLLDVVRLNNARPDLNLSAGETGTIVEDFGDTLLVEFSDDEGQEYAMPFLKRDEVALFWTPEDGYVDGVSALPKRAAG